MLHFDDDESVMRRALETARRGVGFVEPNPAVGAVIVDKNRSFIAEGFHERFGEEHAEVNAILQAGTRTAGAQLFVTLEPCSHYGKTPPCADAVIAAGFRRVVIGCQDPAPHVSGAGIQKLRDAGIEVVVGICESDAARLIAPFQMLTCHNRPWVIAKWAMTLDGRIAARTGHSRWISSDQSRERVHCLRGRVDAIITGSGTVTADDPLLTARPSGPRTALRVIVDSRGTSLVHAAQLRSTVSEIPSLVCVTDAASAATCDELRESGFEVFTAEQTSSGQCDLRDVLQELGRRNCTNALVECGGALLGSLFDAHLIDEVQVYIASKLVGGAHAVSPIEGIGLQEIPSVPNLTRVCSDIVDGDIVVSADVVRE